MAHEFAESLVAHVEEQPDPKENLRPDVDVRVVQKSIKERYTRDPGCSRATLRASARASVETPSPFISTIQVRETQLECSAHEGIGIVHAAPCSAELLLGGLAACAQTSVQVIANALRVPLRHIETYAEGDIDWRGTLGQSREVPVGFSAIRVRFELDAPEATPEQIRALQDRVAKYCIIEHTLLKPPTVESEWALGSEFPTLHQFVFSCSCEKVRRALHHKGLKWRSVETDWFNRKELHAISGQTLTPVLVHKGKVMGPDSMALVNYIEDTFDGPTLFPDGCREACQELNEFSERVLFPIGKRAFMAAASRALYLKGETFEKDVVRLTGCSTAQLDAEMNKTFETYAPHLRKFDEQLATRPYLMGDRLSAADHIVYSQVWFAANNLEFRRLMDEAELKHLSAWEEKMRADYFTRNPF